MIIACKSREKLRHHQIFSRLFTPLPLIAAPHLNPTEPNPRRAARKPRQSEAALLSSHPPAGQHNGYATSAGPEMTSHNGYATSAGPEMTSHNGYVTSAGPEMTSQDGPATSAGAEMTSQDGPATSAGAKMTNKAYARNPYEHVCIIIDDVDFRRCTPSTLQLKIQLRNTACSRVVAGGEGALRCRSSSRRYSRGKQLP